jgi:D-alanine-D-alanine ligase
MMAFRIPADVPEHHLQRVQELAVAAFKAIDASGFSRCDFFLETATDRVILNEINTIPGMTAMSGFPRLWAASGVDGATLVNEIVRLGIERHERLARLKMVR